MAGPREVQRAFARRDLRARSFEDVSVAHSSVTDACGPGSHVELVRTEDGRLARDERRAGYASE